MSFRDVSMETQVELWKSHSLCLLEAIGQVVVVIDTEGRITAFNSFAEEMFGLSRQDVLNQPFSKVFEHVTKAYHYPINTIVKGEELNKKEVNYCPFLRKEGFFLHDTALIRNQMGDIIGAMWLYQDITEQRKYEREVAKAELLAAVSELAAGTAHEIRNPLTTVRGFIQLLSSKHANEKDYYELMLKELDRANKIIGDFLALAKPRANEMGLCSINHLIEDILLLVESQANLHDIGVVKDLSGDIPLICLQPDQIKQVFLNLIRNSVQAMPDRGLLYISTKLSDQGDFVLMEIKDTGVGIPADRMAKLFVPFFSTKTDGSGLGLTISYRIVKNHGGDIQVESEEGKGTVFRVSFPVSAGA